MSESNGYPVRGILHMLADGSSTLDQTVEIINMYIEHSAKKCYAEGVLDSLKRPQRAEKDVVRDVTEEEAQMDQLKRWSAYKQGVLE